MTRRLPPRSRALGLAGVEGAAPIAEMTGLRAAGMRGSAEGPATPTGSFHHIVLAPQRGEPAREITVAPRTEPAGLTAGWRRMLRWARLRDEAGCPGSLPA